VHSDKDGHHRGTSYANRRSLIDFGRTAMGRAVAEEQSYGEGKGSTTSQPQDELIVAGEANGAWNGSREQERAETENQRPGIGRKSNNRSQPLN
jgi:hypothetical protein